MWSADSRTRCLPFWKEAENTAFFPLNNVFQYYCCKQTDISLKHRQKRLKFCFYMVGGALSRYMDISRRNRRNFRYVTPEAVTVTSATVTVTFRSTKRKFLPSLLYRRSFRNFERTSEQNIAFRTVKGIAEKRRIEQSPNKSNWANTNRTSKPIL